MDCPRSRGVDDNLSTFLKTPFFGPLRAPKNYPFLLPLLTKSSGSDIIPLSAKPWPPLASEMGLFRKSPDFREIADDLATSLTTPFANPNRG